MPITITSNVMYTHPKIGIAPDKDKTSTKIKTALDKVIEPYSDLTMI